MGRTPQEFLQDGDIVETEVEGIGTLRNRICGMSDALAAERQAIREVIENWVLWRDAGDWERFATVWHDDGWMTATWFQGPARDFIAVSKQGFERGVNILHFLGGFTCDIAGDPRHLADEDDHQPARRGGRRAGGRRLHRPLLRLPREARRAAGASCAASRSTRRTGWIRSIRRARLTLDPARLASFPEGYRHLGYLQSKVGFTVKNGLPGLRGPAVEKLYAEGAAWLAGSPTPGVPL